MEVANAYRYPGYGSAKVVLSCVGVVLIVCEGLKLKSRNPTLLFAQFSSNGSPVAIAAQSLVCLKSCSATNKILALCKEEGTVVCYTYAVSVSLEVICAITAQHNGTCHGKTFDWLNGQSSNNIFAVVVILYIYAISVKETKVVFKEFMAVQFK